MKKSIFTFVFIFLYILTTGISYSIQGWYELPQISANTMNSIYFIDENTGFACGNNGSLFKTTDGALTWQPAGSPGNFEYSNIFFTDNQKGILTTVPMGSEAGYWFRMFVTSDQGVSWTETQQYYNFISDLYNDNSGFYFSIQGFSNFETLGGLFHTQNNSMNFVSIPFFNYFRNSSVFSVCRSNNRTWISAYYGDDVGTDVNRLGYTADNGSSWNIVLNDSGVAWKQDPMHNKFYKIRFINESIGFLSSKLGLMKTLNGGDNWSFIDTTITKGIQTHFFTSADTGWVYRLNNIYKTTNGGENFELQFIYNSYLTQPFFINSLTGYILCSNQKILKTITGGLTDVQNANSQNIPNTFSLSQNYPNPFNPKSVINYELQFTGLAKLKVYDVLGNEVAVLVNEKKNAGSYSIEFDGNGFASGVYFYKLEAGDFAETKRMILLK